MADPIVCTIINPSDSYTLVTEDFKLAAVAVALLGHGNYGLEGGGQKSPVLFGWDRWFDEQGIPELGPYVDSNRSKIADVLDTVMIGNVKDRADAEAMLAMLAPEKRTEWLAGRHDRRRSSMNDIGGRSSELATRLRAKASADSQTQLEESTPVESSHSEPQPKEVKL